MDYSLRRTLWKNFQVTFYKVDNEPAGKRLVVMVLRMPGLGCVIFFLVGLVCVKLLLPEPDCAQISSSWSFCMGFSMVASSVCVDFTFLGLGCVIFFLVGLVCVKCLSPGAKI